MAEFSYEWRAEIKINMSRFGGDWNQEIGFALEAQDTRPPDYQYSWPKDVAAMAGAGAGALDARRHHGD